MIGHPVVAEILASAGFEWIALDMEHGIMDWPQAAMQMMAMQGTTCAPMCRLPANDPVNFKLALDAGATGVIVPMIRSAEEAHAAVASARYPPEGVRGVALGRAQGYGALFDEYVRAANAEILVALQIEHIDSINQIEEICSVPGVDAVFIGPYDLSGSMNRMGQLHHPEVEQAVAHALEVAKSSGVAPGLHIVDPRPGEVAGRVAEGFRFIAVGLDVLLLGNSARALAAMALASESQE
jgi:2-dehydro-3-deoxyglucarate aldolase